MLNYTQEIKNESTIISFWVLILCGLGLIILSEDYLHINENKKCEETVYYFWNGYEYERAQSQQFLISFTGNTTGYFKSYGREYRSQQYYKELKTGKYINGKCKID